MKAAALLLPERAALAGRDFGKMSAAALASVVFGEVGLVCAGAAAGATVRYAAHEAYVRLHARLVAAPAAAAASDALGLRGAAPHPPLWGVVGVNIAASFVLGALASEDAPRRRNLLIGTGFCGGMSSKWRLRAVAGLGLRPLVLALTLAARQRSPHLPSSLSSLWPATRGSPWSMWSPPTWAASRLRPLRTTESFGSLATPREQQRRVRASRCVGPRHARAIPSVYISNSVARSRGR